MTAVEHHRLVPEVLTPDQPHLRVLKPVDRPCPCSGWRRHAKRGFDVVVVMLMLPLVLPLMVVIAIITKLSSRGPILFRHDRIGRHGKPFRVLKFRTMYVDATERLRADHQLFDRYVCNDYKLEIEEDPRITPLGRFLRRSSLDELPQLFNVLRGSMSLVGPRPIVAGELARYGRCASAYLAVKPGITGRWQTDGRNHIRYPERAMLDAEYVAGWRLRSDVIILAKTVPCVVRRYGSL